MFKLKFKSILASKTKIEKGVWDWWR